MRGAGTKEGKWEVCEKEWNPGRFYGDRSVGEREKEIILGMSCVASPLNCESSPAAITTLTNPAIWRKSGLVLCSRNSRKALRFSLSVGRSDKHTFCWCPMKDNRGCTTCFVHQSWFGCDSIQQYRTALPRVMLRYKRVLQEKLIVEIKNSPHFMESIHSLLFSHEVATGPYSALLVTSFSHLSCSLSRSHLHISRTKQYMPYLLPSACYVFHLPDPYFDHCNNNPFVE